MKNTYFIELLENMDKQAETFETISKVNIQFRESIIIRDWPNVNDSISRLNELSLEISNLENMRVDILVKIAKEFKSKESEDFFSLISKAPEEIKETLVEEYYRLKSSITTVKGVYKGVNDYIEHKKEISKEVIDTLVNDSKGNTYTKPGRKELGSKGFLINRQL